MIYDFETGTAKKSSFEAIPIQLGIFTGGSTPEKANVFYLHPGLFENPNTKQKYTLDDVVGPANNPNWTTPAFQSASDKAHGLTPGGFRSKLEGKGLDINESVIKTQGEAKALINKFFSGSGKKVTGFNSDNFDITYLGKLIASAGVSDKVTPDIIQAYAKKMDDGGSVKEANALIMSALDGATSSDVMVDLDKMLYRKHFNANSGFEYKDAAEDAFNAGFGARGPKKDGGFGGRTNRAYAEFFMGAENVDSERLHDAGYDVYVTAQVEKGATQLKEDLTTVQRAMKNGDKDALIKFRDKNPETNIMRLESLLPDEYKALADLDVIAKADASLLIPRQETPVQMNLPGMGGSVGKESTVMKKPVSSVKNKVASMKQMNLDFPAQSTQSGMAKMVSKFNKYSGMKKTGIMAGVAASMFAGTKVISALKPNRNEEQQKREAMDLGLYGSGGGDYAQY